MILLFVISQLFIYWFVYIFHRTPGHGGRGGPPPVRIDLKISHQEVELQKAENAWKPKDKGLTFDVKNFFKSISRKKMKFILIYFFALRFCRKRK